MLIKMSHYGTGLVTLLILICSSNVYNTAVKTSGNT